MTVDFTQQRIKMVDGQLRTADVGDRRLLGAMMNVPRELFVPSRRRALSYIDEDLEVAPARDGEPARFLMEPATLGRMIQLADISSDDFVLDIGCATGYSSAVLSRLAGSVIALESDPDLARRAGETLSELGFDNVAVVEGPLARGCEEQAPFDVIIVNGAVDRVPDELIAQLRDGGRLVAVLGEGLAGRVTLHIREGEFVSSRTAFNAAVKPLVEFRREPSFEF